MEESAKKLKVGHLSFDNVVMVAHSQAEYEKTLWVWAGFVITRW